MLVVPAIGVAEFYFLSVKPSRSFGVSRILETLALIEGIVLSDLGRARLECIDQFPNIPDIHDRLIAAEAKVLDIPISTRDETLAASLQIETIG